MRIMRKNQHSLAVLLPAVALTAAIASTTAAGQTEDNKPAEVTELDTVVVEGTKSNQTYLDTNSSLQVVTPQDLEKSDIKNVRDLNKVVPGLTIESRGNRMYANSTLRGISSSNFFSPSLSVYVDGVLQDSAFSMQELVNVKSVEILKGPQGTLFGGNSHGGIINVVTFKGSEDPYAQISMSADNLTRTDSAVLATPIGNGFSVDLALFGEIEQGRMKSVQTQTDKIDGSQQSTISLGLHYRPIDGDFSASLKAKVDTLDSGEELYVTEKEHDEKKTSLTNFFASPPPSLDRTLRALSFNWKYQLSDALAIEGATGVQNRRADRFIIGGNFDEEQDKLSQELRVVSSPDSGISYVLGLFYERTNWKYDQRSPTPTGVFARQNKVNMTSLAAFADTTIPLSPAFDVSLGLRYGVDESDIDYSFPAPGASFDSSRKDHILLPKVGLGVKLSPLTKIYATVSAGYRPSGFNYIPSGNLENNGYSAERSRNHEIGFKAFSSDRRLSFNSAAYFIEIEKVQLYTGQMPNQVLQNRGNAESKGIEIDTSYAFTDDRDSVVSFGVNWGKAVFTDGNEQENLEGRRLQYSPETTANLGIQYKIPQTSTPGKILLGLNGRHTSKLYFNEANSLYQDAYGVLDASIKYVTKGGSSVQIFGNNITDTKYSTYQFAGFGPGGGDFLGTWGKRAAFGIAGTARL